MRVLLVLIIAGFVLILGGEARAHAVLLETNPADRLVVADAPREIALRFNEVVEPILIELRDSQATAVPADVNVADRDIRIRPRTALANGAYIVSYRITSADSHPVAGSFLFAVGSAPAEWMASGVSAPIYTKWTWAAAFNRALFLAAAMIAAGGVIFQLIAGGTPVLRPFVLPIASLGVATAILGIYLQGGLLLDAVAADPFDGPIWRIGLTSTRGSALSLAAAGFVLLFSHRRVVSILGAAAVLASFVLSGHAATAAPQWIAIPTLLLHVSVVAFWLGSLSPLLAGLTQAPRERNAVFRRFSDVATVIVPQLVVAGLILTTLQVQKFDALFGSAYSLILLTKLMLVGLLFTLAACNRWILMPEMIDGVPGHVRRFRYSIFAEIALGFSILVATAFLSQTVPPRALAEHEAAVAEAARESGQTILVVASPRKALIMLTPSRAGRNTIRVRVLDSSDAPVEPLEVSVDLSNSVAGIEPLHRDLTAMGEGYFELTGPELTVGGSWTVRVHALINDFEKSFFETEILVK